MTRCFVLVPGAGGDAWQFHRLVPLLEAAGAAAVAVQLPNSIDVSLTDHADAIVAAAIDAGAADSAHHDVVLVAHSLGGFAAPLVEGRLPVGTLVLLNAMIAAPGETPGAWFANTGQPEAQRVNDIRQGRDPDADFDPVVMFLHDAPPEVVEQAMSGEHDDGPAESLFSSVFSLEAWPDIPTVVLSGRDDRMFPLEFQRRVARQRLGLEVEEIPGGHMPALSHPRELADRLLTL